MNTHRDWLNELRDLNGRLNTCSLLDHQKGTKAALQQRVTRLQQRIIDSPAVSVDDLLVKLDLLENMVWHDPTRRLAGSISRGVQKLCTD